MRRSLIKEIVTLCLLVLSAQPHFLHQVWLPFVARAPWQIVVNVIVEWVFSPCARTNHCCLLLTLCVLVFKLPDVKFLVVGPSGCKLIFLRRLGGYFAVVKGQHVGCISMEMDTDISCNTVTLKNRPAPRKKVGICWCQINDSLFSSSSWLCPLFS